MTDTVGLASCYGCEEQFAFCPDCVVTASVDPDTGRPPDVGPDRKPCVPDPAAVARSVRRPVCDACVAQANERRAAGDRIETEADRHIRHVRHKESLT